MVSSSHTIPNPKKATSFQQTPNTTSYFEGNLQHSASGRLHPALVDLQSLRPRRGAAQLVARRPAAARRPRAAAAIRILGAVLLLGMSKGEGREAGKLSGRRSWEAGSWDAYQETFPGCVLGCPMEVQCIRYLIDDPGTGSPDNVHSVRFVESGFCATNRGFSKAEVWHFCLQQRASKAIHAFHTQTHRHTKRGRDIIYINYTLVRTIH